MTNAAYAIYFSLALFGCQSTTDNVVGMYSSAADALIVGNQQSFGPVPINLAALNDLELINAVRVGHSDQVVCSVRERGSGAEGWIAGDICRRLAEAHKP